MSNDLIVTIFQAWFNVQGANHETIVTRTLNVLHRAEKRWVKLFFPLERRVTFAETQGFTRHVRDWRRVKPSVNQHYGICMLFTREPPSTFVWIIPEINQCPFPRAASHPPRYLGILDSRRPGKQINGSSLSTLCPSTSFGRRHYRVFAVAICPRFTRLFRF